VDGFVRRCGLWTRDSGDQENQIVPAGELTLERLATFDSVPPGQHLFLRFVQEPLDPLQYRSGSADRKDPPSGRWADLRGWACSPG
jgi:hypothetical protein